MCHPEGCSGLVLLLGRISHGVETTVRSLFAWSLFDSAEGHVRPGGSNPSLVVRMTLVGN